MIAQTIQFMGVHPDKLYNAYLSTTEHAAMTAGGLRATFSRSPGDEVMHGEVGDVLHAFGALGPDGEMQYSLAARIVALVPGKLIVMAWRNKAWTLALDPSEITDLDSIVVLMFKENFAGAEIQLVQANVPDYKVRIPETGEIGPLSSIVNTHWSILYWEPMRAYFARKDPTGA